MREDIIKTKLQKLEALKKAGMEPYPEQSQRSFTNGEALECFDKLAASEIYLVGRVKSLRPMGGSAFAHIEDGTAKIQIFLSKKNVGGNKYKLFIDNIEIGDFIEVKGKLFKTKKEEKTLDVFDWKILAKNMRPIPTEYYGLKDIEELLRRRYLDLLMNAETREIFKKKNIFWQTTREFLVREGFLEVDTPALEAIPGGADARPFITRHNALDRDFYLRISLELPLKRLLVGGYEKVFEIGKVFRNEGIDTEHLQDYLQMEFYWAYCNMEQGMEFVEKMYKKIVKKLLGSSTSKYDNHEIKWDGQWPRVDYFTEFKKATGLDLEADLSAEDLRTKADKLGIKYEKTYGKGRMIDTIFKKTVRPKIIQPCFLVGHPIEVSPLAKKDPANAKKVLRFQIFAGGVELGNGFSELNDPIDQRSRFIEQMKLRSAGDEEAQMLDEDFIEALSYGMPPAVGFGMSERFFAFIMNKSIRETVIFPPMKEK
ncbi:MAG: lysine--tRNA ligase [Candidatus Moranbacteria bacterium]|nr:lysine--tRNA ligase [Candidatus Moranbacteria bacterium]